MNISRQELNASYSRCRKVARERAGNFYYSFAVLPREKRNAMCAVYAFMRYCDDIADDPAFPSDRELMLTQWRDCLNDSAEGRFGSSPILPAFHDTLTRFGIPPEYFHLLIDGAASDLSVSSYDTFDQLYDYCYMVASTVGLVCIHIFGFDSPDATKHAEYCGIAFQLTNILRDLKEDVSMGRVYIPAEDLWAFNYGADELAQGVCDERYRNMMRFEVGRARDFYRAAVPLVPLIHKSGRPGLCAMIDIYSSILDQIESNNYDVFAKHILLSKPRKIAIAAKALIKPKVEGAGPSPTESQS